VSLCLKIVILIMGCGLFGTLRLIDQPIKDWLKCILEFFLLFFFFFFFFFFFCNFHLINLIIPWFRPPPTHFEDQRFANQEVDG
jgi:hypothetical protein